MLLFYFSIIGHGLKYSLAIYLSSSMTYLYLSIYHLSPLSIFFLLSWITFFLVTFKTPPNCIQRYILQLCTKPICILLRDKWFQWPVSLALFPFWNGAHCSHHLSCGGGMQPSKTRGWLPSALAAVFLINGSVRVLWSVQPPLSLFLGNIFYLLLCNSNKIALGQPY